MEPNLMNDSAGDSSLRELERKRSRKRRSGPRKSTKEPETSTSGRYHCNNCARDISDTVRIRCAVCVEYDLCIDCFSIGAETDDHRCEHDYRILEVVDLDVFEESWTGAEEERLLEALEYYGIGNWADVSTMIGGGKNAASARLHYRRVYLDGTPDRIPDLYRMVLYPRPSLEEITEPPEPDPKSLKVMHEYTIDEMSGYMPKRGDFIYEWDNEREEAIADMEIERTENARDVELKTRVMEIYNHCLDEREERKRFALGSGFCDLKAKARIEKAMQADLREVWERSKPFFRHAPSPQIHEDLLENILQERRLRERIQELYQARIQMQTTELATTAPFAGRYKLTPGQGRQLLSPEALLQRVYGAITGPQAEKIRERVLKVNGTDLYTYWNGQVSSLRRQSGPELFCTDGIELLTRNEIELCASLRLSPHQYLVCKEILIRENARYSTVRRKDVRSLLGIDDKKAYRIFDYLYANKMIAVNANNFRDGLDNAPLSRADEVSQHEPPT
ncbi:Transcriptional [Cyanidiococcus yangmingshanensis]|uniref:Transcriptional n=1 Tax=Cyanidiococcus yangmingshanensis TaxID=2690220 RepID=A0A7J7ILB3_9RHOD|nr:Transcriptional [Cyanidiococcus yangmingshanensis]